MKEIKAYLTVEASIVLPLVISTIVMTVFAFIYQYDRCLMEQNAAMLALYADSLRTQEADEWRYLVSSRISEQNENAFLFWKQKKMEISLRNNVVEVAGEGEFLVPLPEWNLIENDSEWVAKESFKLTRLEPAAFVRFCQIKRGGNRNADRVY